MIQTVTPSRTRRSTNPPRWARSPDLKAGTIAEAAKGKTIVPFASWRVHAHLLGPARARLPQALPELKAKGVDEVWCVAVNDGFVMAAWARDEQALGKIRFLGDGSAEFAKKLGLDVDLTAGGMGVRMQRSSLLVKDGVVKQVNVEKPREFAVSNAETMLQQLG